MKKLSEYENEEALNLLAEIIEPVSSIFSDKEFVDSFKDSKLSAIKYVLKVHPKDVISILASLDGVPVEEYKCNAVTLPIMLMQVLNDKELLDFFKSQGLEMAEKSSGSATVSIEEKQ